MSVVQKGTLVNVTRILGAILLVLSGFITILIFVSSSYFLYSYVRSSNIDYLILIIGNISINTVLSFIIGLSGIYLLGMFPDLKFNENSLIYEVLIYRNAIAWDEVDEVIEINKKYRALLFNKRWALINSLYGWYWLKRKNQPAIIISLQSENLDAFDSYLKQRL